MRKFLKPAAFLTVLVLVLSMSFCVFATEDVPLDNPAIQDLGFGTLDNDDGVLIIKNISEFGMIEIPEGFSSGAEVIIRVVKIEDKKIEAIGPKAFANCFRLEKVYIPATVEVIDESAFWGCSEDLIICGEEGSEAEKFAEEQGYAFEAVSDNGNKKDSETEGSISKGVSVTILGVGVVFLILVILCVVLKIFEILFSQPKKTSSAPVADVKIPASQMPTAPAVPAPAAEDDTELVAVISAAIAASLGTSTSNFRIKSLRRLGSSWNQAAKLNNFNNNF